MPIEDHLDERNRPFYEDLIANGAEINFVDKRTIEIINGNAAMLPGYTIIMLGERNTAALTHELLHIEQFESGHLTPKQILDQSTMSSIFNRNFVVTMCAICATSLEVSIKKA